ncbi:hypothetical protein [endosymbiont GvMRE of Glomus versiforme]|uniref:hypothetical protein n=1 Tax=endosymbiont GvMRE of Glomus versiforme TaxID=2039283 RepID=UPI000EC07DB0|nr:hypothetical protein [endosymbiont GvMRE of Glomus versiforme]RHZ37010.1 hypothetical protein GvMRE_I2g346 [endosymbiont GvMRE of Glomus versiforme]
MEEEENNNKLTPTGEKVKAILKKIADSTRPASSPFNPDFNKIKTTKIEIIEKPKDNSSINAFFICLILSTILFSLGYWLISDYFLSRRVRPFKKNIAVKQKTNQFFFKGIKK